MSTRTAAAAPELTTAYGRALLALHLCHREADGSPAGRTRERALLADAERAAHAMSETERIAAMKEFALAKQRLERHPHH